MSVNLSVIVPAFNEVKSIGRTLDSIGEHLHALGHDYELIVAADGNDGTRELVSERARVDGRIVVIGSSERRGKGRGIREGVHLARGSVVGFVDADYKTPIEEIEKILPHLRAGFDVVIGSRGLADSKVEVPQRLYRRIGSRAFGLAMHSILGLWGIRDTQCGFKFFRGDVARDLFSRQRIDGYMFDVEILHLAQRAGYSIKEVGVRWHDDGDSRLDLVAGNWRNMVDIVRIRLGRNSIEETKSQVAPPSGAVVSEEKAG